jgi:hypothetical protein
LHEQRDVFLRHADLLVSDGNATLSGGRRMTCSKAPFHSSTLKTGLDERIEISTLKMRCEARLRDGVDDSVVSGGVALDHRRLEIGA